MVAARRDTADGAGWLILGVMTAPAAKQNRRNLRELSHSEPGTHGARIFFVLGDVGCARNSTSKEAAHHGDLVYVRSNDCATWHRGPKVFAWFQYAVHHWPRAHWYGKSEDDGMTRLSSLLRDLRALDARELWYYGIMQLTSSCSFRETCPDAQPSSDWSGCCGGCFAGALAPYPSEHSRCRGRAGSCALPRCRLSAQNGVRLRVGGPHCAEAPIAPFAVGPIEVRSRALARETARCEAARRYMAALSRRGDARRRDCASMDGSQAFTLTMCSPRVLLADATWQRMSYAPSAIRNARVQNETRLVWAHPAKSFARDHAHALWRALADRPYAPPTIHTYELRTSAVPSGGGAISLRETGVVAIPAAVSSRRGEAASAAPR